MKRITTDCVYLPWLRAKQWLSPQAISTILVDCRSSISLGLNDVASGDPQPKQAPWPHAYTYKQWAYKMRDQYQNTEFFHYTPFFNKLHHSLLHLLFWEKNGWSHLFYYMFIIFVHWHVVCHIISCTDALHSRPEVWLVTYWIKSIICSCMVQVRKTFHFIKGLSSIKIKNCLCITLSTHQLNWNGGTLTNELAFYQGLELSFAYGALTCSSAIALSLVLQTRDYNLAPSALVVVASKM